MSELDKTIEELEAEVLAELEEAEDPAKKGAAPAEKSGKIDKVTPGGEVQDIGGSKPEAKVEKDATKAVNDPDDAIGKKGYMNWNQIKEISEETRKYVNGYKNSLSLKKVGDKSICQIKVNGNGDYLPKYAGNLDIITSAAIRVAENYEK